jgi:hypothetical protein
MTFLSIRKYHPESKIDLFIARRSARATSWKNERQDFQSDSARDCYISELPGIGVNVIESDIFPTYPPNYQSDLFRWWWLFNNGGFYMDTDQIVLRSFKSLPLNSDFIFSSYRAESYGVYSPVGVLGAKKFSPIADYIKSVIMDHYNPDDYNSIGPFMLTKVLQEKARSWSSEFSLFNSPPNFFYPVQESPYVESFLRSGNSVSDESFAIHWFGGNKFSQRFNIAFDEEYANSHDDLISLKSRELIDFWKNNF